MPYLEEKKVLREKQILAARVELEYGLLYSHYKSSTRALGMRKKNFIAKKRLNSC